MKAESCLKCSTSSGANYYSNLILPLANDHNKNEFIHVISSIIGLKLLNHGISIHMDCLKALVAGYASVICGTYHFPCTMHHNNDRCSCCMETSALFSLCLILLEMFPGGYLVLILHHMLNRKQLYRED